MIDNQPGLHLTDDQFTELLLGAIPPQVAAHLKQCAHCAEEAERVSAAIGSFEHESRIWAERRAASLPMPPARQPMLTWLPARAGWASATAAVALVLGVGALHFRGAVGVRPGVTPAIATAQPAAEVSPATLQADNALLAAIDGELRESDALPSSAYGLKLDSNAGRVKPGKRMSN